MQFRLPSVTYSSVSSGESATLLGLAPLYPGCDSRAGSSGAMTGMLATIAFRAVSMISTVSDWSSATNSSVWAAFSVILFGCPFTGMRAATPGVGPRLTTTISRSRTLDTYAVALDPLPFTTTQNGYSPPGTPGCGLLTLLPGRRSIPFVAGSGPGAIVQWPSPPVNTVIESL